MGTADRAGAGECEMTNKKKILHCECGAERTYRGSIESARKYARKFGWRYTKFSGDKCPVCIRLDFEEWQGMIGRVASYGDG
jgi:hypothetical protein